VLACGALVRELRAVLDSDELLRAVEVDYLPAPLHNRPERIVPELERRLEHVPTGRRVFLGYADCGTGGLLDAFILTSRHHITRLPGAHCYEFFAGTEQFAALHDAEPGTLYLTDFLARHFDALIWGAYQLDAHPELVPMMFGNYRRVVWLAQSDDADVAAAARSAAQRLGLDFVVVPTGLEPFATPVRVALGAVAC
jgi:hypothetical protein